MIIRLPRPTAAAGGQWRWRQLLEGTSYSATCAAAACPPAASSATVTAAASPPLRRHPRRRPLVRRHPRRLPRAPTLIFAPCCPRPSPSFPPSLAGTATAKSNFGLVLAGDKKMAASKCTHSHVGYTLRGEKARHGGAPNPESVYIVCSQGDCRVLRTGSTDKYRGTDVVYPGRLAGAREQVKESGWPTPDKPAAAGAGAGSGAGPR